MRSPTRRGGGFIKFLATIVLVALLVAVGWTVFVNWAPDEDGKRSFDGLKNVDLTDTDSWTKAIDEAKPVVEWSEEQLASFKEKVWGEDGLLADAEDWLATHKNVSAKATASATDEAKPVQPTVKPEPGRTQKPTVKPTVKQLSPRTERLESKIRNAYDVMAEGIGHYNAGNPSRHGWTDQSVAEIRKAKDCFQRVRVMLVDDGTVDDYAEQDDHDPSLLSQAKQMIAKNQKLLHTALKVGSF